MKMFEIFGEFDSHMEINMAAEGLLEEGDLEGLRKLAEENGLSDYTENYINGETDKLCDAITAALGKLDIEKENAREWAALADDVVDYIKGHCDDVDFAMAVRKKGKYITKAAERVEAEAKKHTVLMPDGKGKCHYCGPMKGYQLIKEYYTGGGRE